MSEPDTNTIPPDTDESTWREPRNRRGFLGFMGRVGIVAVGGVAGLVATQSAAEADGYCNYPRACCCLKHYPGSCPGSGSSYSCPSGWTKKTWACCTGGRWYGCGECVQSTSCWVGPWVCSEYWYIGPYGC